MKNRKCIVSIKFNGVNEQLIRSIMFAEFEVAQKIIKYTKSEEIVYKVFEKQYKKRNLLDLSAKIHALDENIEIRMKFKRKFRIFKI